MTFLQKMTSRSQCIYNEPILKYIIKLKSLKMLPELYIRIDSSVILVSP